LILEYIPSAYTLLVCVLSFALGWLYSRYVEAEDISESFQEGYEKGIRDGLAAVSEATGMDIRLEGDDDDD